MGRDRRRRTVSRSRRAPAHRPRPLCTLHAARCTAAPSRTHAPIPAPSQYPCSCDYSEMPQKDCSVQVSIKVQPGYNKLQVIVDIYMSNSSASTGGEGAAPPPSEPDPALDSMHMMLDPHLRPISPDLNNEESKRIFEEHKQLAQEYLKIQTEFAYLSNHKAELEEKMDDDELRQKREIIQLEKEKDSLIKLYCSLKKQLARAENDSWLHPEEMPHE